MLGHLRDAAVATPAGVGLYTLDIHPQGVRVESRLEGGVSSDDPHRFYSILLLQEDFKGLAGYATLKSLDVALVLLCEDSLRDEEVRQLVLEDVNLEPNRLVGATQMTGRSATLLG